jgi:hypothetical protein
MLYLRTTPLRFWPLGQDVLQFRTDFVRNHLPDRAVLGDAALRGVGYVPVRDPVCCDHLAEIGHVHLYDVVELDVRKMRNVRGFIPTQLVGD